VCAALDDVIWSTTTPAACAWSAWQRLVVTIAVLLGDGDSCLSISLRTSYEIALPLNIQPGRDGFGDLAQVVARFRARSWPMVERWPTLAMPLSCRWPTSSPGVATGNDSGRDRKCPAFGLDWSRSAAVRLAPFASALRSVITSSSAFDFLGLTISRTCDGVGYPAPMQPARRSSRLGGRGQPLARGRIAASIGRGRRVVVGQRHARSRACRRARLRRRSCELKGRSLAGHLVLMLLPRIWLRQSRESGAADCAWRHWSVTASIANVFRSCAYLRWLSELAATTSGRLIGRMRSLPSERSFSFEVLSGEL